MSDNPIIPDSQEQPFDVDNENGGGGGDFHSEPVDAHNVGEEEDVQEVVDAGYPNRPGYLCPYKGKRYHIPEWHREMEPKTPKERLNRIHSSIRNVIERSFGLLKMKRQILYKMPSYPMCKQKMFVVATMVLHNFIREHDGVDLDFAQFDRDPNFIPTIPERYHKYVAPSNRSTTEPNAPSMDAFHDELSTALSLAWG